MSDTSRVGRVILANIVTDAFGTAVFLSGVGFFTLTGSGIDASHVLTALAVGGLVGIALSYPTASLVDMWGARPILLALQAAQVAVYVTMAAAAAAHVVVAACAVGAGLGRIASPVRGALPPLYLLKGDLVEFKARVKVWTMVLALLGGAVAAAVGAAKSAEALIMIPTLNALSFAGAFVLTLRLPQPLRVSKASRPWWVLYRPSKSVLSGTAFFGVLLCLGYVPESATSVLVAGVGLPTWVVAASPALALAVALAGRRAVRGLGDRLRDVRTPVVSAALALEVAAAAALALVVYVHDLPAAAQVALSVLAAAAAELAMIGILYLLWDIQYSVGTDHDRGGIVGVFTIGTSAGMALSPALASALYFHGSSVALFTTLVVVALLAASGWAVGHALATSKLVGSG
jgi:hypothetical protein